jgi:hypothetical protein
VVYSLEKACDGEEEELAMILVVKEEEGACELVEAWHMEQELVLAVKSPPWEEVEICTCMEETGTALGGGFQVAVSPLLGAWGRVWVQGAAYNGLVMEREMEEEEIYKGMASEVGIYSMWQLTDLLHKCSQQSE